MSFPISLHDLPKALNELLPAGVTYDSGRFAAGNVHASSQLFLQSDGGMSFSGQVHESGVVGDNFILAMALLDVKDASGNTLVFVHQDTIAGQLDVGFSNKEWHDFGFNQLVKDNWDAVKHTRVETRLHVSTDPLQLIETVIGGLFAAIGVVIGIISATKACPEGSHWECRPVVGGSPPSQGGGLRPSPNDPNGGVSVDIICRCEFN
ncbi:MAG: hypothetical protein V7L00_23470 [Nostoc sp.]|uniref:hypothetical protein n=1 Tax=Nostoc sp. TaxID=1180 RepID=UPI002FF4C924